MTMTANGLSLQILGKSYQGKQLQVQTNQSKAMELKLNTNLFHSPQLQKNQSIQSNQSEVHSAIQTSGKSNSTADTFDKKLEQSAQEPIHLISPKKSNSSSSQNNSKHNSKPPCLNQISKCNIVLFVGDQHQPSSANQVKNSQLARIKYQKGCASKAIVEHSAPQKRTLSNQFDDTRIKQVMQKNSLSEVTKFAIQQICHQEVVNEEEMKSNKDIEEPKTPTTKLVSDGVVGKKLTIKKQSLGLCLQIEKTTESPDRKYEDPADSSTQFFNHQSLHIDPEQQEQIECRISIWLLDNNILDGDPNEKKHRYYSQNAEKIRQLVSPEKGKGSGFSLDLGMSPLMRKRSQTMQQQLNKSKFHNQKIPLVEQSLTDLTSANSVKESPEQNNQIQENAKDIFDNKEESYEPECASPNRKKKRKEKQLLVIEESNDAS